MNGHYAYYEEGIPIFDSDTVKTSEKDPLNTYPSVLPHTPPNKGHLGNKHFACPQAGIPYSEVSLYLVLGE